MEQCVLVPSSVSNKSVTMQSFTEQNLPKSKAEQPQTYQIDSLKRDSNKKLFGKADTLTDKILSCSLIKLSNSQTILLGGVDTGVLISDFTSAFASKKRRRSRHLLHFTRRCYNITLSSYQPECQS